MLAVKTVKIPVHYGITRRKLSVLDSLTARTTYGVWIWSRLFKEHALKGTYADRRLFHARVKEQAKLSGAMAQCCFDTAAWMWKSYREAHETWRRSLSPDAKAPTGGFASCCGGSRSSHSRTE